MAKKTSSDENGRLSGTQSIERALTLIREIAAHARTLSYDRAGYGGSDPDGYMSAEEVAGFIAAYAKRVSAPVRTHTAVTAAGRLSSSRPGRTAMRSGAIWTRCSASGSA